MFTVTIDWSCFLIYSWTSWKAGLLSIQQWDHLHHHYAYAFPIGFNIPHVWYWLMWWYFTAVWQMRLSFVIYSLAGAIQSYMASAMLGKMKNVPQLWLVLKGKQINPVLSSLKLRSFVRVELVPFLLLFGCFWSTIQMMGLGLLSASPDDRVFVHFIEPGFLGDTKFSFPGSLKGELQSLYLISRVIFHSKFCAWPS